MYFLKNPLKMYPNYDLDDDMEVYGPLHGGEDINSENFQLRPQHEILLEDDLPEYDPFEKW